MAHRFDSEQKYRGSPIFPNTSFPKIGWVVLPHPKQRHLYPPRSGNLFASTYGEGRDQTHEIRWSLHYGSVEKGAHWLAAKSCTPKTRLAAARCHRLAGGGPVRLPSTHHRAYCCGRINLNKNVRAPRHCGICDSTGHLCAKNPRH